MIFIRVDLPAPLSPSNPSTSPFLKCRLTSLSAVTGPKRWGMCATRRTSSGADSGPTTAGAVVAASAKPGMSSARTRDEHVRRHRDDDRQAAVEEQVVGVDALQDQSVLEDAEKERADERAHDGPGPSRQKRAADHRAGDRVEQEFVRSGRIRLDRLRTHRLEDSN